MRGRSTKVAEDAAERHYENVMQAQLGERVTNLGRRQTDFESEMRSGFTQMEAALSSIANETRSSIAALSQSINERNKPQWQALGVALTFCIALGGLAYWPINAATGDLKVAVGAILAKMDTMVTQKDLEYRQARSVEDRARTDAAVADLREKQVPREEHQTHWASEAQVDAALQKQIDELRANQAQTYSARDIILELQESQKRLEREMHSRTNAP